jgi:hypothetical protein
MTTSDEALQIQAVIAKAQTLVDGGLKITIDTQEPTPQQFSKLFSLKGKAGWLVFKENEVTLDDIPEIDSDLEAGEKPPSKRIRGKLYLIWERNTDKREPFDLYYRKFMKKIEDKLDEQLDA